MNKHSVFFILHFEIILYNIQIIYQIKVNKTKQNKTKQNKTKQNKTKQNKTKSIKSNKQF